MVLLILTAGWGLGHIPSTEAFAQEDRVSTSKAIAHYAMGQVYDLLGLTNRAVFEYEKAVQFDESSYVIHLHLGLAYARLNMLKEAKQQLFIVNKQNSEELQSHYLLALIYSIEKDYDQAAQQYEYILQRFSKSDPQNVEVYGYLGQLYYSQKKYDQAIDQFEKMLTYDPQNADIMYLLGSLYLEINQADRAADLLKESIHFDPEHDGSLNTLGYLYAEKNIHLDEAVNLINRALKINPNNGAYLDSLGWVYYKKGMYEKALEIFQKADSLLKDPVIFDHIGDVYYKMNHVGEAIKYWEKSLEILPDQKEVIKKINEVKNIQVRQNL